MMSDGMPVSEYIRRLEDAVLILWSSTPTEEVKQLREEAPSLIAFLAHLHHLIEHEQAMTRQSIWAEEIT